MSPIYEIIHTENDGMNNSYKTAENLEFKNLEEDAKYLREEVLTIPKDEEIIYEDGDDSSYTLGFDMFSEKEILEANPEIESIDELDEIPIEYYTIQEALN